MVSEGEYEIYLNNGTTYTQVLGCTVVGDDNYNEDANTDDNTCVGNCVDVEMDGYTYESVQIGDQCWFAENLRTTVYTDGSTITAITDGTSWVGLTSGACAVLDYDESNGDVYGHHYNWHAVDNASGLCPSGWHVASASEWDEFENFLIDLGYNSPGSAAAEPGYWPVDYTALDAVGFSTRAGGYISPDDGASEAKEEFAYFWTSTEASNNSKATYRFLDGLIRGNKQDRNYGMSVRCIQDSE